MIADKSQHLGRSANAPVGDAVQRNVLGGPLMVCSTEPMTGFFRNGICLTCEEDVGQHTVCAVMTEEFLRFSADRGNDLVTPRPELSFPGLKPGDRWCVCVARWVEALHDNCAPPVILEASHAKVLDAIGLDDLRLYEHK